MAGLPRASCIYLLLLSLLIGWYGSEGFTVSMETNLRSALLTNYSASVRPDMITLVQLSITLLSINYVDLKQEEFSLTGWWSIKWTDSRLSWSGNSQYTLPVIQVYQNEIWTPALVVDNSIDDLSAVDESSIPLRVREDGQVTWNPPGILVTSCEMDVTYFPFDQQTCSVQVTSFGYTIQELNITVLSTGITTTYFSENGEWTLLKTWNERSEFLEDGYDYAKVSFYFLLERRSVYYGLNTMLPVLLNSLLIPLVFLLPHDSGEKTGYCLTVLLAYVVILTIVTDGLPTTAKTQSLLGVYIAIVLSLSGASVSFTIHSLHIYHRPPNKPVPEWQAKLTRFVQTLVLQKKKKTKTKKNSRVKPEEEGKGWTNPNSAHHRHNEAASPVNGDNRSSARTDDRSSAMSLESVAVAEPAELTWLMVAQVYDSFLLRFYFILILVCSISFLFTIVSNRM